MLDPEYRKAYYEKNKERIKARERLTYEETKAKDPNFLEKQKLCQRKYMQTEKGKQTRLAYVRSEHGKAMNRKAIRRYYMKNREKILKLQKEKYRMKKNEQTS